MSSTKLCPTGVVRFPSRCDLSSSRLSSFRLSTIGAAQNRARSFLRENPRPRGYKCTRAWRGYRSTRCRNRVRVSRITVQLRRQPYCVPSPRALTLSQRQQIGRAGRRARDSLAIYVPGGEKADGRYFADPDDLFDKPTPELIVNLESELVIEAHLQCAAFEMPLSSDDTCWFGPLTTKICETKLVRDKEGWCVKLNFQRQGR